MTHRVHTSGGVAGDLPPDLAALLPGPAHERLAATGRLCLSGAAPGSDAYWGDLAWQRGDGVVHWSFAGHSRAQCAGEVAELTTSQLARADSALRIAADALARPWPPRSPYAASLLRRDFFQADFADALYAIAKFDRAGRMLGGTAWTVQMFLDRFTGSHVPAFAFDQRGGRWLERRGASWQPVAEVPSPAGIWAGIGTRDLDATGMAAIQELLHSPGT